MFLLAFLLGCTNPFSTRTPEKPPIDTHSQPVNALQSSPDSLFKKLQLAFSDKNINYYMDCLSEEERTGVVFDFKPSENEIYRFIDWQRQNENNYFNRLVNTQDLQAIKLQIFNNDQGWTLTSDSQDTMQTQVSYEIMLQFKLKKEYYRGESLFRVVRSPQSLWYVFFWEDFNSGNANSDSTWSTLKYSYQ